MPPTLTSPLVSSEQQTSRARKLQFLGLLSGFTAGAWLGAAEAPTKLVSIGLSPMVISLIMVIGVFLARWSVPALILGTSSVRADVRRAPHLIIWALLAGCLWAVANTMTIFAIRDVGLSIAFPLWNSNSLLGILWGFLFFNELRQAGWRRWAGVLGGALVMCVGAALLAIASSAQAPAAHPMRGVWAALGAGVLWGTMYIPYRKAYLTGMNPLSFITFFTFGELGMMSALAVSYLGLAPLWHQLQSARDVLFWLMLGGFIWVIGDLFQQYAAKYIGISRGIPLSNTNQLWGLLWGTLVFGELHGRTHSVYAQVIGALPHRHRLAAGSDRHRRLRVLRRHRPPPPNSAELASRPSPHRRQLRPPANLRPHPPSHHPLPLMTSGQPCFRPSDHQAGPPKATTRRPRGRRLGLRHEQGR
jgi:drug/metabolite transporter (DMT)-like permease